MEWCMTDIDGFVAVSDELDRFLEDEAVYRGHDGVVYRRVVPVDRLHEMDKPAPLLFDVNELSD